MRVGILALQGAFIEHAQMLARIGVQPVEVRLPEHLEGVDGLIIPGGESTTIGLLAKKWGLIGSLREFAFSGRPIWGTCAGMILLAKEILDGVPGQPTLELMDIAVRRNAFGRQVESFEVDLAIPVLGDPPFHAVFIRAPVIERVGAGVEVLASLEDGTAVAVQQGNLLATAFHPELTKDTRFHQHFVRLTK